MDGTVSISEVVLSLGLVIHFITFVGIFTKLENRLTKLETQLEFLIEVKKKAP